MALVCKLEPPRPQVGVAQQDVMEKSPNSRLGTMFYTGASSFLEANEYFARALVTASSRCTIHASEDIVDANGLKLWSGGQPISERLLERLSNRRLRKPIELCVYASDPIATAGLAGLVEAEIAGSPDLAVMLESGLSRVLALVKAITPNPTELMLLSVMRHGGRDMLPHAARVCAVALAAAELIDVHPDLMRNLARAALFHDVGELYLPPELFDAPGHRTLDQIREIRRHAAIGAQVSIELARVGAPAGHLIAMSHERLDGWGYPHGLGAGEIPLPAQALLFAEAMVTLCASSVNGVKRAAVAARVVPGEFPAALVDWIVRCAKSVPAACPEIASAEAIGMDLLQIGALLSHLRPLFTNGLPRETTAVRVAAIKWSQAIDSLINELGRTGVESAISHGMSVAPQSDTEYLELAVLGQELLYRIREIRLRVEVEVFESPELGSSALVIEFLELLRACEPAPEAHAAGGKDGMTVMAWSKLFSVGVREIDEQHRVLIGLLNRLLVGVDAADAGDLAARTLADLVAYVEHHFAYEEKLMREHDYEATSAHLAAHIALGQRVAGMVARNNLGTTVSLVELTVFLRQWLISHILLTDKALGAALNAKGVH